MLNSHVLHTDLYAFTMLAGALHDGTASRKSTFSLFTRSLPRGRGYGVVAGTHRAIQEVRNFSFTEEHLDYLREQETLKELPNLEQFIDYLRTYEFSGTIEGLPEGDVFFENTPIMYVHGEFGECIILEALLLSIMNHDSAIASAAARMRTNVRHTRALVDMGTRRTHEDSAIASARAAWMVGFDGTSNVEAARRYPDISLVGTSAHAFILLHDSELEAFKAQAASLGEDTIYLVDTYNIEQGIRNAVEASNGNLAGIRLDSGDPGEESVKASLLLEELGVENAWIVVSGDMDEYTLARYRNSPIHMFGVGTNLVTGSGHPTCGMVYKLVERENSQGVKEPVAKASAGKATIPGYMKLMRSKCAYRGELDAEVLVHPSLVDEMLESSFELAHKDLLDEEVVPVDDSLALQKARAFHRNCMVRLPLQAKELHVEDNGIYSYKVMPEKGEGN